MTAPTPDLAAIKARAEAAEAREAALVAKVEALAEECGSSGCIHLNDLWGRLRTLLAEHATPSDPPQGYQPCNHECNGCPTCDPGLAPASVETERDRLRAARGVVHMAPEPGHGTTPCCRMVPFELPRDHRMTTTPKEVTCPAPASVETGLSEDEREALYAAFAGWSTMPNDLPAVVERILSDRLAAVERDRDRFRGLAEEYHGRLGDYVETHGPLLQRAETAEAEVERLRAVVAAVEALADEWERDFPSALAACNREPDEWWLDLRAALATAPVQAGTGAQDGEGDRS